MYGLFDVLFLGFEDGSLIDEIDLFPNLIFFIFEVFEIDFFSLFIIKSLYDLTDLFLYNSDGDEFILLFCLFIKS
jgi:hypothetical protein